MKKMIKITSASITGQNLTLTANVTTKTVNNGERDAFCICTSLPVSSTVVPVVMLIGETSVPLLDSFGNTLYSDQITCRTPYVGVWGTNVTHFRLFTCLPRSQTTASEITIE
jgi:hypothetical protein